MTTVVDAEVQLTVVSDAAGRMRVQATGFQFDAGRAVAIEDTVGKVAGVQAVHAYPRTASIVIWYSRAICDTAAILSAIIDAETVPAAAVPAYASRSASNRKAGVVQKIIDWSTRTLSGVRRDVAAQPSGETSDACCDGEDNEDREPEQLWQVAKLRRAAFSGVLLTASLVAAWAYPLWPVVLGLKASREEVLAVAAALEARSEHPLAVAVLAATQATTAASDVQAVPGAGLIGRLDGRVVRLGRPGWLDAAELADHVACMQQAGATAVLVERDQQLLGAIAVRDELRPEAAEVVAGLRTGGYQVTMLTGDNHATAAALAAQAGIEQVHAELRPEDKAHLVAQLRARQPTAMVGDGVNDAPALAAADLGIAMGAMGTDVAIETADVALMGQDLRHLPQALDHARRSRQIMVQNVGLSLSIITVLMPLALFGILGLAAVVLVHEFTEVIVIANGVRAGRIKPLAGPPKTPDRTIPG